MFSENPKSWWTSSKNNWLHLINAKKPLTFKKITFIILLLIWFRLLKIIYINILALKLQKSRKKSTKLLIKRIIKFKTLKTSLQMIPSLFIKNRFWQIFELKMFHFNLMIIVQNLLCFQLLGQLTFCRWTNLNAWHYTHTTGFFFSSPQSSVIWFSSF